MGIHDQEVKRIIKEQETYVYRRKFPRELKAYLYDTYGEDPWLYEFSMCDLYSGIKVDAREYFMGKLDVTRKPSHQKTPEGIEYFRKLYSNAMCENRDLQNYINELHDVNFRFF